MGDNNQRLLEILGLLNRATENLIGMVGGHGSPSADVASYVTHGANQRSSDALPSSHSVVTYTDTKIRDMFSEFATIVSAEYKKMTTLQILGQNSAVIFQLVPILRKHFSSNYVTVTNSGVNNERLQSICIGEVKTRIGRLTNKDLVPMEDQLVSSFISSVFRECVFRSNEPDVESIKTVCLSFISEIETLYDSFESDEINVADEAKKNVKVFDALKSVLGNQVRYSTLKEFCMERYNSKSDEHFRQLFEFFIRIWIIYPYRISFSHNEIAKQNQFDKKIDLLIAKINNPSGINTWKEFSRIEQARSDFGVEYNALKEECRSSGLSIYEFESVFILEFLKRNLGGVIDALMHGPMALEAI
jgi:hypothetical protein